MGFEASDYLLESALKPVPQYNDTGSVIQSMSNNEGELWKASFLHHIALGFCLGKKKKILCCVQVTSIPSSQFIL